MTLRNYGIGDIVMHERSQLFCNMFHTAFPKFTATYADDFRHLVKFSLSRLDVNLYFMLSMPFFFYLF